jgi:hypothetical protein
LEGTRKQDAVGRSNKKQETRKAISLNNMTKQQLKYYLSITILSLFLSLQVKAQVYPVQINTQLIPPYSLRLSDYVSPGTNRVGVNILLTDVTEPEYYIRLELLIEGDGITIRTSPSFNPGPIILQGGVPEYLTSSDLTQWFEPQNLDFTGYSKSAYLNSGRLPEGVYRISFCAYDYNKHIRVSNNTPITAWMLLNDPPIINLPFPDYKVEFIDPQNIVFQWTPRHTASPNSAFTTEYEFTLVEIWPDGRDPNNAIQTSVALFQTTTMYTTLVYGLAEPFLEPGRQYAYRIQAYDTDGRDMFKNNGYSEVRKFTFGDACKEVNNVEAKTEKYYEAEISWQPAFNQTAFNVRYRKANDSDAEWFEEESYLDYVKLTDLQEQTKYEYQLMAYCGSYDGDYTDIKTFTTPAVPVSSFECGANDDESNITNHDPLPVLYEGNYVWSGNFMFKIKEATGSNGTFSGKAYAMIPYLSYVKLEAEFSNIKINTDNQVYEGTIKSVYNPDSPFIIGIGGDDDDDDSDDDTTDDTEISDTTFTSDIDSVYIDGDEIIIVTEDGTDTIHTSDDIIITDEDGDTWTVEDGVVVTGGGGTGPGGGGSGNGDDNDETEEDKEQERKVNKVRFEKYPGQNNGFDPYDEKIKAAYDPPFEFDGEEYYASWKALKEGSFDHVNTLIELGDTAYTPNDVKFKMATGTSLSAENIPDSENKSVYLFGQVDETEDEIIAYVTETDTAGNELDKEIGKLRVVSYREEEFHMKLVPVNIDLSIAELTSIANNLNDIYNQSVVRWDITFDDQFDIDMEDWDKDENELLDDSESGLFSNYTKEMNKIISKYKKARDTDNHVYYVFLLGDITPQSGDLVGYMPFKQQFGLIFLPVAGTDLTELSRIVSHEIGHGAFRLWHTFSSNSSFIRSEKTTNNLMDYNNGTHLNKYQWDFIHNPEAMIAWTVDDEEAEMMDSYMSKESIKSVIDIIRYDNISNEERSDLSVYALSKGVAANLELTSDFILDYIEIEIKSGKNIGTSENPFLREALIINSMGLKYENITTPSGQEGNFIKVYYNRFDKASPPTTGFVLSDSLAISFIIKETQKDEFEEYLHSIKTVFLSSINWVSQFDEDVFGLCTGCWTTSCCRRAAEYMMGNTNIANCTDSVIAETPPYMPIYGRIDLATFSDNSSSYTVATYNAATLNYDNDKFVEAIKFMKDKLRNGLPLLIGTHYINENSTFVPNNANRATRHFMVVVGMGMEGDNLYFRFYDPGRSLIYESSATSTSNKLIINRQQSSIQVQYRDRTYTLTEIVKVN